MIPILFWDQGPETATALKRVNIQEIAVPVDRAGSWKSVSGIKVDVTDPARLTKLPLPSVNYHADVGSASSAPWVDSNGWRFVRDASGAYFYDVKGKSAALAAAEAYANNVQAFVRTDNKGLEALAEMLTLLHRIDAPALPEIADVGFVDDGSPESGEVLNLLARRNLLVRCVSAADPKLSLTVKLGSSEWPRQEATNPSLFAEKVRSKLTDERRSLRIWGSYVVLGRLSGTRTHDRLYLINYAAGRGDPASVRVRVLGTYTRHEVATDGASNSQLLDFSTGGGATEFTVPDLNTLAVIDLFR